MFIRKKKEKTRNKKLINVTEQSFNVSCDPLAVFAYTRIKEKEKALCVLP